MLLLLLTAASLEAPSEPVLGQLFEARKDVHDMSRAELAEALTERGAHFRVQDSDSMLQMRLYQARSQLLDSRNTHVTAAEKVMNEVAEQSTLKFLSDQTLETILADDNAIFSDTFGKGLLFSLQVNSAIGAAGYLFLARFAPFGRIQPSAALLPFRTASPVAIATVGAAMFAVLQVATRGARRLLSAPSNFGQKVTAATCREGLIGWVHDETQAGEAGRAAPSWQTSLWTRRGVVGPVLMLAVGSSLFEEVTYRGVLLHGLLKLRLGPLRLGPRLAAILSSAAFGVAHVSNEQGITKKCIYAVWTAVAGLICSATYIGTGGGFGVPILLHFVNNAIVFGVSAQKVAQKLLAQHEAYVALHQRVAAEQASASLGRAASTQRSTSLLERSGVQVRCVNVRSFS